MLFSCFKMKIKVNIAFNPFTVFLNHFWPIKCSLKGFVYLILIPAVWAIIEVNKQFSLILRP